MRVRCGRCRSELEVPGPGTFVCPACGTQNQVQGGSGGEGTATAGGPKQGPGGLTIPPAPPTIDEKPAPRVTCGECSFEFAVGQIEVATCPMCNAEVPVETKESA